MYKGIVPPKTHVLLRLAAICSDFDNTFVDFELDEFASYSVDIRYDSPIPTLFEAKRATIIASEVMNYTLSQIIPIDGIAWF